VLDCDVTELAVVSDRALVARVLHNLVANAVRYTAAGRVGLHLRPAADGAVQLVVEDSGIGIDADELPRIFEEFYQVGNPARDRGQGLGLGLATVKRLSDLLALDLQVRSERGRGSSFSIRLIRSEETAPAASHTPDDANDALAGRQVLVLEDDPPSREALVHLLEAWHCRVRASPGALEALAWVQAGYRPDVVLADLRLAEGGNGCEIASMLKLRLGLALPVLLVSGDVVGEGVCQDEGDHHPVLRKPVNPMQLRAFMNAAFAKP
jgi:CheY-like chemotaxis protein/anti-sigma regulatory factor (Ser/Thr protein kinase)